MDVDESAKPESNDAGKAEPEPKIAEAETSGDKPAEGPKIAEAEGAETSGDKPGEEEGKKDDDVTFEKEVAPAISAAQREREEELKQDELYFASLSQEELEWYKELGPKPEAVKSKGVVCTCCFKQITGQPGQRCCRHPLLGVVMCKTCRVFYERGEWKQDEDGND